ncbi:AI-2E family transporter [Ketobacter sp.]
MATGTGFAEKPQESTLSDWQQLNRSWLFTATLVLIFTTLGAHLLVFASSVLIPLLFGFYLAALLYTPMLWLKKLYIPEALSALILVLLVLGTLVGSLVLLKEPAEQWLEIAPDILSKVQSQVPELRETMIEVQSRSEDMEDLVDHAMAAGDEVNPTGTGDNRVVVTESRGGWKDQLVVSLTSFTWTLSITLILCYFFLVGGDALARNISATFRRRSKRITSLKVIRKVRSQLAQYIVVTMCVNLSFGLLIAVLLWLFGAEYPVLWGILVGLMRYIPYIGNVLSLVAVTAAVATNNLEVTYLIVAPASTAVLMFICGNFVDPFVHARQFQLNPIVIFVSIIFWSWIWGVAGLFIAVPTLLVIAVICGHIKRLERIHLILCSGSAK